MDIYVARQPIYGVDDALFGYEFLYRNSMTNQYDPNMDGNTATRSLLSNLITEFGLDSLTGGAYAFVNFTRDLLDTGCPFLFSPSDFIIEILEDVACDEELLEQLRELKDLGYTLALDDYTGDPALDEMAEIADIIKVDIRLSTPMQQVDIARRFAGRKQLLAEKIETEEELLRTKQYGYTLFQGYYFSRPVVLTKRAAELASATYARLWNEIRKPEPSFDALSDMVRADVNLSYKLLIRANSAFYYRGHRIHSVKVALVHMGIGEIKRWVLSVLMRDLNGSAGDEASKRSLIRAIFAEKMAVAMNLQKLREDAYTAGLFSTIDRILGGNMEDLLRNLSISEEARMALIEGVGPLGEMIQYIKNYELGHLEELPAFLETYRLVDCNIADFYLHAVEQAEAVFGNTERKLGGYAAAKRALFVAFAIAVGLSGWWQLVSGCLV